MSATGAVRQFDSPPLAPGNYNYQIRARWNQSGHEVIQTRQVEVEPGSPESVTADVLAAPLPATGSLTGPSVELDKRLDGLLAGGAVPAL